MTAWEQLEADAGALRACADEIDGAFDGLVGMAARAWDCPAADAFDLELRTRLVDLSAAVAAIRSAADTTDIAADAARQAAAEMVAGVGHGAVGGDHIDDGG